MLSVYELHDLHMILISIRAKPDDPIHESIVLRILSVFEDRFRNNDLNQIRKALQSVEGIEKRDIYSFVFTENNYTYSPLPFLKDERIYGVLRASFEELLVSINKKDYERIHDLADCLHNLPIVLAENHYTIPKSTWKFIKYYRSKWNNAFLTREQRLAQE